MSKKLYVGQLPEICKRADLQALFDAYGEVLECDIVKNYAFVHFATPEEAQKAADELNGIEFQGINLSVELSHSKVRQKPGMGGKGECYRCGKTGHWSRDCPKKPAGRGGRRDGMDDRRFSRGPRPSPYGDPYGDPYRDDYFRDRYEAMDRYRGYPDPYARRLPPPPPRDPYYREADPYARPPPEYYGRARPRYPPRESVAAEDELYSRDRYYDAYYARGFDPLPGSAREASSPIRSREPLY